MSSRYHGVLDRLSPELDGERSIVSFKYNLSRVDGLKETWGRLGRISYPLVSATAGKAVAVQCQQDAERCSHLVDQKAACLMHHLPIYTRAADVGADLPTFINSTVTEQGAAS
jgi:hypothetical protein